MIIRYLLPPTITTGGGPLAAVDTTYGSPTPTPTQFTVSGAYLTDVDGITVDPPAGYEVSTSIDSDYAGSGTAITVGSAPTVPETTIYVRLAATAGFAGSPYSGDIVCSSAGADPKYVATEESEVSPKLLTIGAPSIAAKDYDGTDTAGAVTVGTLEGFVGSETVTATGAAADYSSPNADTYPGVVITYTLFDGANGGLAANYTLENGAADGVINQKALTVTATGPTKTHGTALTAGTSTTDFTADATGVGSETVTSVTLTPDEAGLSATTAVGQPYVVTPSLATGSNGFLESNYDVTYTPYNGTVGMPKRLFTAAEVTENTTGPIGTAQATLPVIYGVNATYLNGDLFTISNPAGVLSLINAASAVLNAEYYVEITATDGAVVTDTMLVKITVVSGAVPGTIFMFR